MRKGLVTMYIQKKARIMEFNSSIRILDLIVFRFRFCGAQDEVERYGVNSVIENFSFNVEIRKSAPRLAVTKHLAVFYSKTFIHPGMRILSRKDVFVYSHWLLNETFCLYLSN